MSTSKENDRNTLINRKSIQHGTNNGFFFPRLKSVHRGEEGYLENQHYEVKAAERERGDPTTQDVLYYLPCLLRLY